MSAGGRILRSSSQTGWSLIELLVAVAIFVVLLFLSFSSLNTANYGASTNALAGALAEYLRSARQQAIAARTFITVAFPSNGGTVPVSQSLYRLQGYAVPKVTDIVDFSQEYPDADIFVGDWTLSAGLTNTLTAPHIAAQWTGYPPPNINTSDYALVFQPNGTVTSNQQILFNNAYHILVTASVQYQNATVGGAPTFSATAAFRPCTITVYPEGSVTVTPGIAGVANGAVAMTDLPPPLLQPPASALQSPPPATHTPSILSVSASPPAYASTLPSGVDALVTPQGVLSLHVIAQDFGSGRTRLTWSANGGALSFVTQELMERAVLQGTYTSTWEWTPPPNAAPGTQFQLSCTLTDNNGNTASGTFGAGGVVQIVAPAMVAYESDQWGGGGLNIYTMQQDGSNQMQLTFDVGGILNRHPRWSPDGTHIAYESNRSGNYQIYLMDLDGSEEVQLTNGAGVECTLPCWSPDGTYIAYIQGPSPGLSPSPGGNEVWTMNADGSNAQLAWSSSWVGAASYVADDSTIVQTILNANGLRAFCELDNVLSGATASAILSSPATDAFNDPAISPNGSSIAFTHTSGSSQSASVAPFTADQPLGTVTDLSAGEAPCWNKTSTALVYAAHASGYYQLFEIDSAAANPPQQLTNDSWNHKSPSWWQP